MGQTFATPPSIPFPCKIFFILSGPSPGVALLSVCFLSPDLCDWSLYLYKAQMLGDGSGGRRVPFWMPLLLRHSASVFLPEVTGMMLVIIVLFIIKFPQIISAPLLV